MIYHSQFNDQSEHTNQTAEIVLWYALEKALNADFTDFLSAFKWVFNNSMNAFTDQIFNKIIYEFNLTDSFSMIINDDAKKFKAEHKIHQQEAQDLIAWANLVMKNYYDRNHISLLLNLEDLVMLKCYEINRIKKNHMTCQACQALEVKKLEMYNTSIKHVKHNTC